MAPASEDRIRLRIAPAPRDGVAAHGVTLPRSRLAGWSALLARRAGRYPALRLSLAAELAVFWSASGGDLPWFGDDADYLAAPRRRVFTPTGWHLDAPDPLLDAWLAALRRDHDVEPALLALPESGAVEAIRVIALGAGAPLDAVDWRLLTEAAS